MLLLVTTGHPDMARYAHPNLGRLIQPRETSSLALTAADRVPWAADNDCYNGGLDEPRFLRMLDKIMTVTGCLFITVPDVVADHAATLALWEEWRGRVALAGPAAFVLQDGCREIPTDADAVFVGGSTRFKMGDEARLLVTQARRRGLWTHMGRVNSARRIQYANSIGCDSVDGTGWVLFKETHLRRGLALCAAPANLRLEEEQS